MNRFTCSVRPDIVRLGEQNLVRTDDKAQPQDFGVADVIVHPEYKSASHYFDIAVVRLSERVRFTPFIRPACLWQNEAVNSTRAVATGWGQVEFCEYTNCGGRNRKHEIITHSEF